VVYETDGPEPGSGVRALAGGLHDVLPRHAVVTLHITRPGRSLARDAGVLDNLLDIGSMPVVVTPADVVPDVVAEFCERLQADRVLTMSVGPTGEVEMQQVWHRCAAVAYECVGSPAA
jgi:hypothetical protein